MAVAARVNNKKELQGELDLPAWPPVYPDTAELLLEVYRSGKWSFNGNYEKEFNRRFAQSCGAAYSIFMFNGTVTLECALEALNIGPGDEVIVPAYTWIATLMAVLYVGATPVIVDIEPDTLCMDPARAQAAITLRTKAIIPVHLYGSMADMDRIMALADKHKLFVIEDCAHAHGGVWNGKGLGSIGHIGSFSFQESKTMPCGEGGCCTTNDPALYERLNRLKHIGYQLNVEQGKPSEPPPPGLLCRNYRGTEFQAVILLGMLERLCEQTAYRAESAEFIREKLKNTPGIELQAPGRLADIQSYYMLAMLIQPSQLKCGVSRDDILNELAAAGITAGIGWGGVPVYRHQLWNVPEYQYRIDSNSTAEKITTRQLLTFKQTWLLASRNVQEKLCQTIHQAMTANCK